jgi:hypothetical protein
VSTVACELSLPHVPTDRVVRIAGASDEQLAVGLDPLPRDARPPARVVGTIERLLAKKRNGEGKPL